jgi:site-specific DNA-methyltransferase (adenine-specific)
MLEAMRGFLGENDMMAYLAMMAIRLIELHRVLKPTGSLYLHCDPTASHYLKILLDAVFGVPFFHNEIIWKRTSSHGNVSANYGDVTDSIFYYSKGAKVTWNPPFVPLSDENIRRKYAYLEPDGRRYTTRDLRNPGVRPNLHYEYKGYMPHPNGWSISREKMEQYDREGRLYFPKDSSGRIRLKLYLDESQGRAVHTLWDDIPPINSQAQERLGYPTQKPVALLERIISASSNPDDLVLDPFCGCGTTIHAAQKLGRRWIGIDVTPLAINLIKRRLSEAFGSAARFEVIGLPNDLDGAKALFEQDPHAFQLWAVSLIPDAQNWKGGRKGADTGIDGQVFLRTGKNESRRAMISVKGGKHVGVAMIRDLGHVVDREKALLGLFLTLTPPTRDMETEAVKAGYVETDQGRFRKLQILTIEQLLNGARPELPFIDSTAFKRAKREETGGTQHEMDI